MKEKELSRRLENTYVHLRKDILIDNEWLSVSDKNIFVFSDLSIDWQRKHWDKPTYKVSFNLTNFRNETNKINLYLELDEMNFVNECYDYIENLFVFIKI